MSIRRHLLAALIVLAGIGVVVWAARDRLEWPDERADRLVIANLGGTAFECLFLFENWVTHGPDRFPPGLGKTYPIGISENRAVTFLSPDESDWGLEAIHCLAPASSQNAYVRVSPLEIAAAPVLEGHVRLECEMASVQLACGFAE